MRSIRFLALASAALFTPAAYAQAPAPAPSPTAQSVLAAAKLASGGGGLDKLTTTRLAGTATLGGLSGGFVDQLDWVHVREAGSYELGPGSGANGWDGKSAWTVDSSKQVRVENSAEAVSGAVESAYFATFAFYFPDRYPAQIGAVGSATADGVTYATIKITPKASDPIEVWFDPDTHLPARMVELVGQQPHTILFSDYRTVLGIKLPFHTITRTGNDPHYDLVSDVTSATAPALPDSTFAPPPPPPYDAYFPAGKTAVTVPIRILNNHIYLAVSFNGKPAVPFMFDTGATNFLDNATADQQGLKSAGSLPGGGFGSAISSVGLVKVAKVAVGGLSLHDQVFATNDLGKFKNVEGGNPGGLIGYEFAKRTVVTIDYAHHTMTFTKPDAYQPPAGVTPVPFTFSAHIPMVDATVGGIAGQFEIDTGSRGALTLMRPFAVANGLVDKLHATRLATTGYGVGGPSKALLARADALVIGPVTLKQPVVDLVMDEHGAAAATHTAGNIGGDLLKRFTLTLDYGHQNLYFQPNALASQPDVFDRSGLWVNRADDGMLVIADVTPDSAASKAGLKTGDEITVVNAHDARTVELPDLREMFKAKPGTVYRLQIKGADGSTRRVALSLADQV